MEEARAEAPSALLGRSLSQGACAADSGGACAAAADAAQTPPLLRRRGYAADAAALAWEPPPPPPPRARGADRCGCMFCFVWRARAGRGGASLAPRTLRALKV
jgi:hypothetical protein